MLLPFPPPHYAPTGPTIHLEPTRWSLLDNCGGEKQTRRMRELLERLFQVDFLKGLAVTFRTQHPKNIVTEQYPLERPMVAERYRGAPRLNNNPETGETLWIGCNLCALACPVHPLKTPNGTSQRSHYTKLGHPGAERSTWRRGGGMPAGAGQDREAAVHSDVAGGRSMAGACAAAPGSAVPR